MDANRSITTELEDYRARGMEIIYSARDTKRAHPPPSKPLKIGKPTFPSPPEVAGPKLIHISKTSHVETPSLEPKSRSLTPKRGESKIKREAIHCCNSCRATFATAREMYLHQTLSHDTDDLTNISFSKPVVSPISRPLAPFPGELDLTYTNEQTMSEFVPREQGKLWDPPISTRPKNWDSIPKRESHQQTRRGRGASETKKMKKRSQGGSFREKLDRMDAMNEAQGDGERPSPKDIPAWLEKLEVKPTARMESERRKHQTRT